MSPELWSRIAGPYRTVARDLGYRLLETTTMKITCVDLLYRDGTYLDFVGVVITDGSKPSGVAPGFNCAQFRTFTRDGGALREIYTAAIPDPMPRALGLNAWFSQTFILPVVSRWTPEEYRGIPMKTPQKLAEADARHRDRIGGANAIVSDVPLELRWALQDEIERANEA